MSADLRNMIRSWASLRVSDSARFAPTPLQCMHAMAELQRQIDEITGYQSPQPRKKTIAEQKAEVASLRRMIDDLKEAQ